MGRSWLGVVGVVAAAAMIGCNSGSKAETSGVAAEEAAFVLVPAVGGLGQALSVRIEADHSAFEFGATSLDLGAGVVVTAVTVLDGYTAVADVMIDPVAELGARDAAVTVEGRTTNVPEAFTIISESFLIEPNTGKMGELVDVAFVGANTAWEDGYTWASFGDDVYVTDFDVLSPTLATARIAIPSDATPGPQDVSVESGALVTTLVDGFQVDRASVTAFFEPDEAYQGDTVAFTVTGLDTNFGPSSYIEFWDDAGLNPDITVLELTVIDNDNMFGRLQLSNAAKIGYRDVVISNGTEAVLVPEGLEVLDAPPDLADVAVGTVFDVYRSIDPVSGELYESVVGYAYFIIPLDPPCGSSPPPGDGPMPYDVNGVFPSPPSGEETAEDCPNPETVSAGDYVWYESDVNIVTLTKDVIESTGQIIYYGTDLTLDDYRFGKYYDLHTQGDPEGIPEVTLEGIQPTVPGDYYLVEPSFANLTHPRVESFEYWWTPAQTYPTAIFSTSISGTLTSGDSGFAGCVPWDDGVHTYTPAELLQLEPGPVSFSASSYIEGPLYGLPFSTIQVNQSTSVLSTSASLTLE
jgi:hypothetical protein